MKINIFGSTGIIGSKTLDIIKNYFPRIKINLLCANTNVKKLIKQIQIYSPKYVYLNDNTKIKSTVYTRQTRAKYDGSATDETGYVANNKMIALQTGINKTLTTWSWNTPLIDVDAALKSLNSSIEVTGRVIPYISPASDTSAKSLLRFNWSGANKNNFLDILYLVISCAELFSDISIC